MKCPKDGGLFRTDHDLEMPSLVCMTCGHRIFCPPPPRPERTEEKGATLHCNQCRVYPKLKHRSVCRRCLYKIENAQRERRTRGRYEHKAM